MHVCGVYVICMFECGTFGVCVMHTRVTEHLWTSEANFQKLVEESFGVSSVLHMPG